MNCKHKKIRTKKYKKYMYCSILKQEITYNDCLNCGYKEYKERKPIKKRSYLLSKAEKERFSILTTNLNKCSICGKKGTICTRSFMELEKDNYLLNMAV